MSVKSVLIDRNHKSSRKWLPFVGDCSSLSRYLATKEIKSSWVVLKFADALLRGFGQVVLANNPFSGFLILLAMAITFPNQALGGVIAGSVAIAFSTLIRQPPEAVSAGLTAFNSVLLGIYGSTVLFEFYSFKILASFVFASMICVYLTAAIGGLLSKWSLPNLTIPFVITHYIFVLCVVQPTINALQVNSSASSTQAWSWDFNKENLSDNAGFVNNKLRLRREVALEGNTRNKQNKNKDLSKSYSVGSSNGEYEQNEVLGDYQNMDGKYPNDNDILIQQRTGNLDWGKTFSGMISSSSQVYGMLNIPLSTVIYLAIVIYSPIMCSSCCIGAILGTLTGSIFAQYPYDTVYDGVWGYNGFLCGAALGGFFYVWTWQTAMATVVSVLFSVVVQQLMRLGLSDSSVSELSFPFCVSTIVFLCVSFSSENTFPRPVQLTFPEKHRYDFLQQKKENNPAEQSLIVETKDSEEENSGVEHV